MTRSARPRLGLTVLTCMDVRIDVGVVLGLAVGDAHVLRNAGGRVTDDLLRSLSLSVSGFGVTSVVLLEHTQCGTKIDDHRAALRADIAVIESAPGLEPVERILGMVYDVESSQVEQLASWVRSAPHHAQATSTKHEFATLLA